MNTFIMPFKKIVGNPLVQLICTMIFCFCFYKDLSTNTIQILLTISSCLREILVSVLPFLIFSFIAVALSSIPRKGMLFVLGLMGVVSISNFMSIMVSGAVGFFLLSDSSSKEMIDNSLNLVPFFHLNLPIIMENSQALLAGVTVGFINSFYPNKTVTSIVKTIQAWVMIFMKRFFIPSLPIFVAGFFLKLLAEGKLTGFVSQNPIVYLKIIGFLWLYLLLWLAVAASFRWKRMVEIFKNAFPAIVTSFSTMSSAAALPLSLEAAEKNTKDKVLADAVMPLTVNFHMIGDTIVVPIMSMMVLLAFNHPLPSIPQFVMFGIFFVLNKFAGGGVPSGTIMVTLPILQNYFGYDDSMTAFIVAFYGVMDPIATSGSVAGNNFFVVVFKKIKDFVRKKENNVEELQHVS